MMNPEDISLEPTPTYFTIWHWLLFFIVAFLIHGGAERIRVFFNEICSGLKSINPITMHELGKDVGEGVRELKKSLAEDETLPEKAEDRPEKAKDARGMPIPLSPVRAEKSQPEQ